MIVKRGPISSMRTPRLLLSRRVRYAQILFDVLNNPISLLLLVEGRCSPPKRRPTRDLTVERELKLSLLSKPWVLILGNRGVVPATLAWARRYHLLRPHATMYDYLLNAWATCAS